MIFAETELKGAYIIDLEAHTDERGFFARAWAADEFAARGLNSNLSQCSISYNRKRGTLRGMHYQVAPHEETKVVRCTAGAIFDVIIDLQSDSPTFKKWVSVELSADNRRMIYVPVGFAHGFQTLTDGAEVFYQICEPYHPERARGVRWDDEAFGIEWPEGPRVVSQRDIDYRDFAE